jgi:hypothetical protein
VFTSINPDPTTERFKAYLIAAGDGQFIDVTNAAQWALDVEYGNATLAGPGVVVHSDVVYTRMTVTAQIVGYPAVSVPFETNFRGSPEPPEDDLDIAVVNELEPEDDFTEEQIRKRVLDALAKFEGSITFNGPFRTLIADVVFVDDGADGNGPL